MSLKCFLRDRIFTIAAAALAAVFSYFLVTALGCGNYAGGYLAGTVFLVQAAALLLEYLRRRGFYRTVQKCMERLDQKYLISELLEEPSFEEGRIFCQVLREANKSMNDEIGRYKRASQEYRKYIETWVHEIKTPISSSRLILENNPGIVTHSLGEEMDRIEDYVEQALFYCRSGAVEKDYIIRKTTLQELTASALKKHARILIEAKVAVSTAGLEPNVCADTKWMDFILGQILANSIKYRNCDPQIRITGESQKDSVSLTIADNGIGIPQKDLRHIFEKGFTGTNGRIGAKSTGIGLYLCKKLCNKIGLAIGASSREGEGTAITILFPKSSMYG